MCNLVKYRVIVDRSMCISCGVAPAVCPEVYELGSDNQKNRVVGRYSTEISENLSIGEIPEELFECAKKGADVCPVAAIKVEKVGD